LLAAAVGVAMLLLLVVVLADIVALLVEKIQVEELALNRYWL
jgi:hypothetical protein